MVKYILTYIVFDGTEMDEYGKQLVLDWPDCQVANSLVIGPSVLPLITVSSNAYPFSDPASDAMLSFQH